MISPSLALSLVTVVHPNLFSECRWTWKNYWIQQKKVEVSNITTDLRAGSASSSPSCRVSSHPNLSESKLPEKTLTTFFYIHQHPFVFVGDNCSWLPLSENQRAKPTAGICRGSIAGNREGCDRDTFWAFLLCLTPPQHYTGLPGHNYFPF